MNDLVDLKISKRETVLCKLGISYRVMRVLGLNSVLATFHLVPMDLIQVVLSNLADQLDQKDLALKDLNDLGRVDTNPIFVS